MKSLYEFSQVERHKQAFRAKGDAQAETRRHDQHKTRSGLVSYSLLLKYKLCGSQEEVKITARFVD